MPKKSIFETKIEQEINKREVRLNSLLNEKVKLITELETLKKSREIFTQSRKRQKINGEPK